MNECMYVKNLRFHVCKCYVCTYICVCIYLQGIYSRGGSISYVGAFLTSFLRACSICMQAGSGANMSG